MSVKLAISSAVTLNENVPFEQFVIKDARTIV